MRILRASTGWAPSESTLLRHFHRLRADGPGRRAGRWCSAGSRPTHRTSGGSATPCTDRRSPAGRSTSSPSWTTTAGSRSGTGSGSPRTPSAWPPRWNPRWPPAVSPARVYVDNGSAFVDDWLLRACGKLGIRLVHSTPHRPQGRGKIERFWRTVNDQFLVEVHDTTAEDVAAKGISPAAALLELNGLFTAWVETAYHHNVHSETGQTPLARWTAGWDRAGHGPVMPAAGALTEAFLWSAHRTVTKTATVSLHGNTYQVEPALAGRKVELVFSPFNLEHIEVRYQDKILRERRCRTTSPGTPTPKPDPRHPNRPGPGHRDRLPGHGRRHPPPAGRRRRDASTSTPSTPNPTGTDPIGTDPTGNSPGNSASTTSSTTTTSTSTFPPDRARPRHDRPTPASALRVHQDAVRPQPRPGMLHRYTGHGEAVARISWCVDQHALGVITGEVGAGKTVAVRAATAALDTSRHVVIYLPNPSVGVRGMLHHIVCRARPGPQLLHRDPGTAGRRRAGRGTRRTGPHPRRGHRRGAPAGQPATGSDPDAHQPRDGLRVTVRRAADRSTHPAAPAPPRRAGRAGPTDLRPLRPGRDDRPRTPPATSPTTSKSPAGPTPCSAPTPSPSSTTPPAATPAPSTTSRSTPSPPRSPAKAPIVDEKAARIAVTENGGD